jgi:hypothetical protein
VTTQAKPRSAYPPAVEALLPKARTLAKRLGDVPSRNRLMSEFRVGASKATLIRAALLNGNGHRPAGDSAASSAPAAVPLDRPASEAAIEPATAGASPVDARLVPARPEDGRPPELAHAPATAEPAPSPDLTSSPEDAATRRAELESTRTPVPATTSRRAARKPVAWPVLFLALPAFVAIWSGWVELGRLTGFGVVHPLPGIANDVRLDTAITLPIGVETYAAYALWVWLSARAPRRARRFAKWSAIGSLIFGAAGQVAFHLMVAASVTAAPWQITTLVSCLPVAVLGMGAALAHLLHDTDNESEVSR